MTISTTDNSVLAIGNDATTVWPFAFNIPDAASLNVELIEIATGIKTVVSSGDYSVTGLGVSVGGSVTYPLSGDPLSSDYKIFIYRSVPLTQTVTISNQSTFYPSVVMGVWDRLTMQIQDRENSLMRALRVAAGETLDEIPSAVSRANKTLTFDSTGAPAYITSSPEDMQLCATIADVKALDTTTIRTAFVVQAGVAGQFIWRAGDYSVEVGLDPLEGVYLTADAVASTSGAWVRRYDGTIEVTWFGALGDGSTDDQPAIQAAITFANALGFERVHIPAAAPRGAQSRGYYVCLSALTMLSNVELFGDGAMATELRFTNDTMAFTTSAVANTANWKVHNMQLRGVADTSASATTTNAFNIGPSTDFIIHDMFIQRFVNGFVLDAGDIGLGRGDIYDCTVSFTQFANATNGYPRHGMIFDGGTKKPQGITVRDCILYGEILTKEVIIATAGTTSAFELTGITGLFATSGVRVYHTPTGDPYPILQVEGTDYDLWNTTGTPAALTPGDIVDSTITTVEARFGVAPSAGNITMVLCDPSGARGINVLKGTGNVFENNIVGGWKVIAYDNGDSNVFRFKYIQIANIGMQLTTNAVNTIIELGEYSNKDVLTKYSINAGAVVSTTVHGAGRLADKIECTVDYTATTSSDPIDWDGAGAVYLEVDRRNPSAVHEVNAVISYSLVVAAGSRVRGALSLEKSEDDGATWTVLDFVELDFNYAGATSITHTGRVTLSGQDTTYNDTHYSVLHHTWYRVTADRLSGNSFTILGTSTARSKLFVEKKNRV